MKNSVGKSLKALMVMVVVLSCGMVSGQPQGGERGGQQGPPPIPSTKEIKAMVSDLADELDITDDQETKVLAVYQSHFKEVKSKMSSSSRPSRTEMEKMKATFETKVKELLTKEQQSKFAAYLKKQASQRPS
ncbi:hypothetical protein [Saccharicrinis sp. GN24d3]